ncbi:MAG TPA: NADH-quinone oxidoreductase subunit C [Anaerolineaceae bacterium]
MNPENPFDQVTAVLAPWARWSKLEQPNVLEVSISRHHLLDCVKALREAGWGYLSAITGMHIPGVEVTTTVEKQWDRLNQEGELSYRPPLTPDSFLVLYHFCEGNLVLNLRVHPPSLEDSNVPTLSGIYPVAGIYERELQEMFGIVVDDIPDPARFLLPEDWPEGVYPLRKDFTGLPDEK